MIASPITSYQWLDNNVMVAVRIGPQTQTPKELNDLCEARSRVSPDKTQVWLSGHTTQAFTFDHVFNANTQQQHIYDTCVKDLIDSCFDGFNATVLAYGQTGSGKTYTMGTGFDELTSTHTTHTTGIIPRAVEHLFSQINEIEKCARDNREAIPEIKVNVQYIELYNEEIKDLLIDAPSNHTEVKTHEDSSGRINLNDVTTRPVNSIVETLECLKTGAQSRTTDTTLDHSSRSHAIFTLHIKQHRVDQIEADLLENGNDMQSNDVIGNREFETLSATFHFVDLAGSECAKKSGTTAERAHHFDSINQSLLALGNVISNLGDKHKKDIGIASYRDSKLTHLLQDSLGGNSVTLMIACISPCHRDSMETLNTLQCANRAKDIINKVSANHDKPSQTIISLRSENQMLRKNLEENKRLNDCEKMNEALKRENIKQKQKIEECVKIINEKETLVISYNTEVKHLQKPINEREVAFNHQKEEFDKLESVLNKNLQQKTLEIIKLNENLSKTNSEKCSQFQRNSTETHSLSPRLSDTMSGDNDIEYVDMCDTSTRNNIDQSITDTLTTNVDNEMQSNSHQLLISHIRQPLSNNTFDANDNHLEIIDKTFNTGSDNDNSISDERCNNASQKLYECVWPQCGRRFKYKQNLCNHKNRHNGHKPFKCDYNDCAKSFVTLRELQLHIRHIHRKEKLFKCDFDDCGKEFVRSDQLTTHRNRHISYKPYKCIYDDCVKSFVRSCELNSHIQHIHSKQKLFKCDYGDCVRSFVTSSNLKTHRNRHISYKPYKCNYDDCVKRFVKSCELNSHIRHIHTKQKLFKCDFADCGIEFVTSSNLKTHRNRHTNNKPYKCNYDDCVKSFVRSNELKVHKKHCHTKIKCDFNNCGKEFLTAIHLRKHKLEKHAKK